MEVGGLIEELKTGPWVSVWEALAFAFAFASLLCDEGGAGEAVREGEEIVCAVRCFGAFAIE